MALLTDKKLNQVDIQSAVNAIKANGGGLLKLGKGTFTISNRLILPSNFRLEGSGPATIIKASDNFGEDIGTDPIYGEEGEAMIVNEYVGSNASIYSTLDSNIQIANLTLDGNGYKTVSGTDISNQKRKVFGIAFQYVQTPRVENVDCRNFGILNTSPAVQTTEELGNKESISILMRNCLDPVILNSRQYRTDGIGLVLCRRSIVSNIIGLHGTSETIYVASCQGATITDIRSYNNESAGIFIDNSNSVFGGTSFDITIDGCLIDTTIGEASYTDFYCPGITVSNTRKVTIKNTKINDCYGTGLDLYNVDDFVVDTCIIYNNNTNGHTVTSFSNITIANSSTGILTTRGLIKNCILYEDRVSEKVKHHIEIAGYQVEGVTIEGNKCSNGTSDGIKINSSINNRVDIINNDVTSMDGHGIHLASAMEKCQIINNVSYSNNSSGIRIGSISNSIISSNICYNNGQSSGSGILMDGTATDNLVDANSCFDDQGTATQSYGIVEGSSCNRNVITNNMLYGNVNKDHFFADLSSNVLSERHSNYGMSAKYLKRFMRYYNASGGSRSLGDTVVYFGEANGEQFTTSTTAGDPKVLGLTAESIASTAYGQVQIEGRFTDARADGSGTAIGVNALLSLAGSGNRLKVATANEIAVARALEAIATTGTIDVYIIPPRKV